MNVTRIAGARDRREAPADLVEPDIHWFVKRSREKQRNLWKSSTVESNGTVPKRLPTGSRLGPTPIERHLQVPAELRTVKAEDTRLRGLVARAAQVVTSCRPVPHAQHLLGQSLPGRWAVIGRTCHEPDRGA
jgi:hypothetical protein